MHAKKYENIVDCRNELFSWEKFANSNEIY